MKLYAAIFLLFSALVVSSKAEDATHWNVVKLRVNEIKEIVADAIVKIKEVAKKDNSAVAAKMEPKIDTGVKSALEVLEKTISGLDSKTLTEPEAKKLFGELVKGVANIQVDVQEELAKLSEDARNSVHGTFLVAYTKAQSKANDAFKLLPPK